jgi:hypothetical protein
MGLAVRRCKTYLMVIGAETDRRVATMELLETAVVYKDHSGRVLADRARSGATQVIREKLPTGTAKPSNFRVFQQTARATKISCDARPDHTLGQGKRDPQGEIEPASYSFTKARLIPSHSRYPKSDRGFWVDPSACVANSICAKGIFWDGL